MDLGCFICIFVGETFFYVYKSNNNKDKQIMGTIVVIA